MKGRKEMCSIQFIAVNWNESAQRWLSEATEWCCGESKPEYQVRNRRTWEVKMHVQSK